MAKTLKEHNHFGIDATVIADSKNPQGNRITSVVVTLPRIVLAELNTHRMFSRNSASSRAVPFKKMLKRIKEHPFIPIAFQGDHKGMQGTEYFKGGEFYNEIVDNWFQARDVAVRQASELNDIGVTKQLCNRLLEPFMWHTILVTATEFDNFFELRCPKYQYDPTTPTFKSKKDYCKHWKCEDKGNFYTWAKFNNSQAEIHIQAAAEAIWNSMKESTPKELKEGEWHIPFGDNMNEEYIQEELAEELPRFEQRYQSFIDAKIKIATARCARVSYLNFEGKDDYESDVKLHDMLAKSGHWSPFEHCAKVMNENEYNYFLKGSFMQTTDDKLPVMSNGKKGLGWCRNFKGFIQYRHLIEKE